MHKNSLITLVLFLSFAVSASSLTDRETLQKKHDSACEKARTNIIENHETKFINECIGKGIGNESYCKRFYSDYGNTILNALGSRTSFFYDLPECVKAFKFKKSYRQ